MIKQETYIDENGVSHENLIKTYSDNNKVLLQVETNEEYDIAIDVLPLKYKYKETNKDIELVSTEI